MYSCIEQLFKSNFSTQKLGWLFEFHGILTTMGYSMPNLVYVYEFYMICNYFLYKLTFSS